MNGQNFLDNLPDKPSSKRNQLTIDAVAKGIIVVEWTEIISTYKEYIGKFYITTDAGYCILDNMERFRPSFSAQMAQQAADIVGGMLPTSKIMDLAYLQAATKINATILSPSSIMSNTSYSKKFNSVLEKKRDGRIDLITDCGKAWILSNKIKYSAGAVNYGFFDQKAPFVNKYGIKGWQIPPGTRHNAKHLDYSQVLILMSSICYINDQHMKTSEVMSHPILCNLISNENIINITRMPGM